MITLITSDVAVPKGFVVKLRRQLKSGNEITRRNEFRKCQVSRLDNPVGFEERKGLYPELATVGS